MYLNSTQQALRSALLQQAEEAFSEKPDVAGVVHGRRYITQGARGKRTGLFPSRMNDMTIAVESQTEDLFCLLLERDPNVMGYRCQSLEIEYGNGLRYFSDFLIRTWDNRWLVREIKPNRNHLSVEDRESYNVVEMLLMQCGFDFAVVDATDFPSTVALDNLRYLYHRSRHKQWSKYECDLAMEHMWRLPMPLPLGVTHHHVAEIGLSPLLVEYLLFHGQLLVELNLPLRLDSLVGLPS